MIFRELFEKCDKKLVYEHLEKLFFTNDKKNIEKVFSKIIDEILKKDIETKPDFVVVLSHNEENGMWSVYGYEPAKNCRFVLDYVPWVKWANAHVFLDIKSPQVSLEKIVANILYEMTYNGFSEAEIEKKKEKLLNACKDTLKNTRKIYKKKLPKWLRGGR